MVVSCNEMIFLLKPIDAKKISDLWLGSAWALGEKLKVIVGDNEYMGNFTGLGEHGELTLNQDDGSSRYITTSDGIERVNPQ